MDIALEPIKHSTLTDEIIKRLIGMINSGKLKPGNKLPSEREMMEHFRVSRSSVREALHSLTMIGLLETHPGDGTYVSEELVGMIAGHLEWSILLGAEELVELMEVREPLEIQAAGLAAKRTTPESIEQLRQAVEWYCSSRDNLVQCMQADIAIHQAIAQMSGNRSLKRILQTFQDLLTELRQDKQSGFTNSLIVEDEFHEILKAIEQGDEDQARQAMARHLQVTKQRALVEQINDRSEHRFRDQDQAIDMESS